MQFYKIKYNFFNKLFFYIIKIIKIFISSKIVAENFMKDYLLTLRKNYYKSERFKIFCEIYRR